MATPASYAGSPPLRLLSISRQPIFQSDLAIYGYEIFFDGDQSQVAVRPERAPRTLVDFTVKEISGLVGSRRAFINLTRDLILSGDCDRLPAERVVLEVLEDVPPDPPVVRELTRLSQKGYRIALDDFVFTPDRIPLVEIADIIKIDFLATRGRMLDDLIERLRSFDVALLAEKIETHPALGLARARGFDYFQGFLLGRPSQDW